MFRERLDRDRALWGDRARGSIFLHGGSKAKQVVRKPFCEETVRQPPFNWHSEMHLDSATWQNSCSDFSNDDNYHQQRILLAEKVSNFSRIKISVPRVPQMTPEKFRTEETINSSNET